MADFVRQSGVRIRTGRSLVVSEAVAPPRPPAGRRRRSSVDATAADAVEPAAVAASLAEALDVVDLFTVVPTVEPTEVSGRRRRGAPAAPGRSSIELDVDVAEDESAVVLVEQDGVYNWVIGTEAPPAAGPARRRRGSGPTGHTIHFEVSAHARSDRRRPTLRRGFVSDLVLRPITAVVFKFAAGVVVGQVVRRLEQDVHRGLVHVTDPDPATWTDVEPEEVALPGDRPARLLLLVHGTFSSTRGGFAALGVTDHGRTFLYDALEAYDAVVGSDHATLSEDPVDNAEQLGEALGRMTAGGPAPHVDIVCHSRGALVSRALVEIVLPHLDPAPARIDRLVMVAGPNGGTVLADPDNWHGFVDLYTNLAVAGTRGLAAFAPPAATVALLLKEVLQGLAGLVKAIAVSAVDPARAPGLASMDPDGTFVGELNRTQPLQPGPGTTRYYAVTSDFDVTLRGSGVLPQRLMRLLADTLVDELMDVHNDLVVDVPSMTHVDPHVSGYLTDVHDFGTNDSVFHTNYFLHPVTVQRLRGWLALDEPADGAGPTPGVRRVRPGAVVNELSAVVEQDVVQVVAGWPIERIRRAVDRKACAFVVVRRDEPSSGTTYHYAFRPDELRDVMEDVPGDVPLESLGVLHETGSSDQVAPASVTGPSPLDADEPWARRGVVLTDGHVRGVVPHATDEPLAAAAPAAEAPAPAARTARRNAQRQQAQIRRRAPARTTTRSGTAEAPARRATKKTASKATAKKATKKTASKASAKKATKKTASKAPVRRAGAASPPVAEAAPPHHVRAEMPSSVAVESTADVIVQLSTEQLVAEAAGAVAAGVAAQIDPERQIVVTLVPRSGVVTDGEWQATLDPLGPGDNEVLFFPVKAVQEGPAEVWVVLRQGPQALLTLTLRSQVTAAAGGPVRREQAEAVVEPPPPSTCRRRTLRIYESTAATGELMLKFDLEMRDLGVYEHADSSPIKGDRDGYVAALYRSIEDGWTGSKGDVEVFTRKLRAIGAQLLRELVPPVINDPLWEHREALDRIEVISTEPQIPWEIVHLLPPGRARKLPDEEQFLGMKGLVRWIHGAGAATGQLRLDDVAAVVPTYPKDSGWELEATEQEWEFLAEELGATRVDAKVSTVLDLIGEPGGFSVMHFAGHGEAEADTIAHAALLMEEGAQDGGTWRPDRLTATDVEGACDLWPQDGDVRPMVVLNACQTGRSGHQLTDIGGFARAFLNGGAGVFLGSLWAVGDDLAATFNQTLYTSLRAGSELSDAASAAREASRTADDATWLAYVVYGDPCATVAKG
ncbi:MAG TPA: CHAT domain-containing protein [Nitriliruptorales bacterium]